MVRVARKILVIGEIFGGIDARKGAEVVYEVGLVEIASVESDASPVYGLAAGDAGQDPLEAADAAEQFWRHAHVQPEKLDEAAGAEAGFVRDFGDFDGGPLEQRQFQHTQLGSWIGRREQPLAQFARAESPKILQVQMLVVQFIAGKPQKGNRAAGAE